MIVTNSSPLIVLGRQGRLQLLKMCFQRVMIPRAVYDEVLVKKDSPEAAALESAVSDEWISVESVVVNPLLGTDKLGEGEKHAVSLAAKHKVLLLLDDDAAKSYASLVGVEVHGTIFIVYLACARGIISVAEARGIVDSAIVGGFYISTEVYSAFLRLLDSVA
ncbi:DUF3368 domain-containing protein [Candidatus Woesearchaeota archaeon]|nr:DUF3368 domain-containing protein [Candidatus Woesearchaeota archaeon]